MTPVRRLRPYTAKGIDAGQTLFWGGAIAFAPLTPAPHVGLLAAGLVRVDVGQSAPALSVTFFCSSMRVSSVPTSEVEQFYQQQLGERLTPPLQADRQHALQLRLQRSLQLEVAAAQATVDVCISGLGWFTVAGLPGRQGGQVLLDVWVPKGVEVFLRRPMPVSAVGLLN